MSDKLELIIKRGRKKVLVQEIDEGDFVALKQMLSGEMSAKLETVLSELKDLDTLRKRQANLEYIMRKTPRPNCCT